MYTDKGQLDRSALIKQYQPLVRKLAHYMMAKLPPSVEVDDLIQVGLIGLADALSRYEASQGVQFETFATQRIRGAMLDELRGNDWMSRGSRKSQKDIESTMRRLEHRLGRSPIESEIAAEMGLTLSDYQSLLSKVRGTSGRAATSARMSGLASSSSVRLAAPFLILCPSACTGR
jgi:RNA polymerase sigma factor for flagellar operon FliA